MITAVVSTFNAARDLHLLLSALVPAAADGLVRQVLVLDRGSTDGTLEICEDAGADVVQGALAQAAAVARGEWLLVLPVELRLRRGWGEAVAAHLERGGGPALLVDATAPTGWLAKLRMPARCAVLARRSEVQGLGDGVDLARLQKRAARAPRLS